MDKLHPLWIHGENSSSGTDRKGVVNVKIKLGTRERSLLGVALNKYDALAKGTQSNLASLNLPALHVDTARGNIEVIKDRLGQTSDEVEFQFDIRTTVQDCLAFALTKYTKAENAQTELLIGTSETEETMNEVRALQRKFADQTDLEPIIAAAKSGE